MIRAPAEVGSAANSYEILAKLAMGGMAEIFLARGQSAAGVERYVVLKRVLRHRASDVHFVQMFLDEARLAAQLQHPHIAQVYDIGKLGDSYFFTMEYVHGETVRNLLARSHGLRRQIPISAVLSIIAGAASGLHHAHERKGFDGRHLGIVHRDVSPSNLMLSYEGTVKVVDFGVAKAAHRSTETQSGTVKGKISYMSPEQCRGGDIDRRSDLFSLGIVMWEVLTCEKLFRRTSDFESMQAIVNETVPAPSQLRTDVAPEIDDIVMRLLAKDPAERFQTGDELHEAIENAAVRTGSALSTASLGRFIRELFGQRPEPWIEMQSQDHHPEAFTVTSEPIPNHLALSPAEEFDRKLAAVPALAERLTTQPDPERPRAPTVPLRIGAELVTPLAADVDPLDLMKTQPIPESALRNVVELPVRTQPPSVTPSSSPQYPIASGSHPAFSGHHPVSYPLAQRAPEDVEPAPRRSRGLVIVIPALALGAIIGVALALRGGDDAKPIAAAEPPTSTTTMAVVATPEPPPPPEAIVAPPPVEPIEPPPVEPPAIAMPEDAVTPAAKLKADKPKLDKPKALDKAKPDVVALYKAGSYPEAVATCGSSPSIVALHATVCTVAACKAKQVVKARRWFAQVAAAKKAAVTRDCDGVLAVEKPADRAVEKPADKAVDKPATDDVCKRDPMACQH